MIDRTIDLDQHRGMAAQKATDQRRLLAEVEAKNTPCEFSGTNWKRNLLAAPSADWQEAAVKARYLLSLFVASPLAQDPPASAEAYRSGACRF